MERFRISYPAGSVPALLQEECEFRHFKKNTFKAYNSWLIRFWNFHGKKSVRDLREPEIKSFLASLRLGSASAQDQAFNALIFIYKHVLKIELGKLDEIPRAKKIKGIPVVLSPVEVQAMLSKLTGTERLQKAEADAHHWATEVQRIKLLTITHQVFTRSELEAMLDLSTRTGDKCVILKGNIQGLQVGPKNDYLINFTGAIASGNPKLGLDERFNVVGL